MSRSHLFRMMQATPELPVNQRSFSDIKKAKPWSFKEFVSATKMSFPALAFATQRAIFHKISSGIRHKHFGTGAVCIIVKL